MIFCNGMRAGARKQVEGEECEAEVEEQGLTRAKTDWREEMQIETERWRHRE